MMLYPSRLQIALFFKSWNAQFVTAGIIYYRALLLGHIPYVARGIIWNLNTKQWQG